MRISRDSLYLSMAYLMAHRSTCSRRRVGAILVNSQGHVLATGYNGVPTGFKHCNEGYPCKGVKAESGTSLEDCQAIHAEQNALLQCRNIDEISKIYVTAQPCIHCVKLLLNTPCHEIVFCEEYPHPAAVDLWHRRGRKIVQIDSVKLAEDVIESDTITQPCRVT